MIRTFGVAKNTVLLLASVPAGSAIINTSQNQNSVVWLGSDPNTQPNVGFPLNALSSMEMAKTGPLYAVLDPGTTETVVSVLVGDDLNGYDNPIALASAVASALLVSGIPNVLTTTSIALAQVLASGASVTYDVSKSGSLSLSLGAIGGVNTLYTFLDTTTLTTIDADILVTSQNSMVARMNVPAGSFKLTNNGAAALTYTLIGSNRPAAMRLDTRFLTGNAVTSSDATPVLVGANIIQPVVSGSGVFHSGLCTVRFAANAAVTTGYFSIIGPNGITVPVCETTEMVAGVSGAKVLVKQLVLTPGSTWQYFCTGAAGGNVSVSVSGSNE